MKIEVKHIEAVWRATLWNKWRKSDDIARDAQLPWERTEQPMREIAAILNAMGFPIVSSNRGFMKTREESEVRHNIRHLKSRIEGMQRRIRCLGSILLMMDSPNCDLPCDDDPIDWQGLYDNRFKPNLDEPPFFEPAV